MKQIYVLLITCFLSLNVNAQTQIGDDIDGESTTDQSGYAVSISADGSILAVGAPVNGDNGSVAGHVRVFQNQNSNWLQIGQDIDGENAGDWFGRSVSLSSQGNRIAIGGNFNSDNGVNSGHVRIYELQNDNWEQIGDDIDGISENEETGVSVDLSSHGNLVVISAPGNSTNGNLSGQVRIFEYVNNSWEQIGIPINGEAANDEFGFALSLSSNSQYLAVGVPVNSGNGFASGHVRVYEISALLSVKEINSFDFKLYPNPTKTQFTVQLETLSDLQSVNIYNNLGQLVLTSKETIINTSKLASGLYIVEVETTKGKTAKKLIIQ